MKYVGEMVERCRTIPGRGVATLIGGFIICITFALGMFLSVLFL